MRLYFAILLLVKSTVLVRSIFIKPYHNWENNLTLEVFNARANSSMMVATLPLRLSLSKLASVAEGATKNQLLTTLGYEDDASAINYFAKIGDILEGMEKMDLTLINRFYINYTAGIQENFIANSSRNFGVDVVKVGFNLPKTALTFINNGISTASYRRITDVLEQNDITEKTKMLMISAGHIKITWEFPFEAEKTKPRRFFHLNNNRISQIPMMIKDDSFLQFYDRSYKMLSMALRSPGFILTLIVPSPDISDFLRKLKANPELIRETRKLMSNKYMRLVLPRFKIKSFIDLTENFKRSKFRDIMDSNTTSLDRILKEGHRDGHMFVSKVKQKLFLEVDEFGVTRNLNPSYPWQNSPDPPMVPPEFAADRPFFFSIDLEERIPMEDQLERVHHPLLCGVYHGPE